MNSIQTVQTFLDHIFNARMQEALALVAGDAIFIPTRPQSSATIPLYGTYRGPEGAAQVFTNFAAALKPGLFNVEAALDLGEHALMYGQLRHEALASGRQFVSDWALICKVRQGLITHYHFYEDTAALEQALAVA
ncbi:hypothetical protein GTP23_06795 [Pseudoduganella sp. FT93W]|uniref:SnoaL-like domain-containing protein n=1 Tax=Duganella fentianensis TaxID=2692177 RepID=A0A845HUP9_9BURK|nr:nuclear transport factor 2 family protein [Duganella fentianensis]MYN44780.1 hypothetical protein [Duganella fentianensis]